MDRKTSTLIKSLLFMALFSTASAVAAQDKIFSEDFGTPSSEKDELIEDHVWNGTNKSLLSWNLLLDGSSLNVRSNNPSDYDGASGDGNLYFKGCASFTIAGIATDGYDNLTLSFGAFGKNKGDVVNMKVDYSLDGSETELLADFSDFGLNTGKKKWTKVPSVSVMSGKSLTLTFTSNLTDLTADGGIRLDDILLSGTKTGSGISDVLSGNSVIMIAGNTIVNKSNSQAASVYSLDGCKVAEVAAGETKVLTVSQGIYVVKSGNRSLKTVVR